MDKILIIEDELAVRETIVDILQLDNYEVMQAASGEKGIQMAMHTNPDLVICDINMPITTGYDVISAFKSNHSLRFVPFIFLSAFNEVQDIRKGMNMGAEDYLVKPFNPMELLKSIKLQLNKVNEKERQLDLHYRQQVNEQLEDLQQRIHENERKWNDYLQIAGNIQAAVFPEKGSIRSLFKNSFSYFKPKYPVSGDFYWGKRAGKEQLIAVADCAGHGIPASLMSICCCNSLTLAVEHFREKEPLGILQRTNQLMAKFLKSYNKRSLGFGMDIALCSVNQEEQSIKFVGAKRPIYFLSEQAGIDHTSALSTYPALSGKPIYKIKGGLHSIDGSKTTKLKQHTLHYETGDILYLSSDGYADQFGGHKDKRFNTKNLIQLLLTIQNESMKEQKVILKDSFNTWKGDREQTDDVTLLGIRL
jgi:CheY-like chemotaxis protein